MDSLGDIYEEEERLEDYEGPEARYDFSEAGLIGISVAHELDG